MKKVIVTLALAGTVWSGFGEGSGKLFRDGEFLVGCNYWASHAGMYMWRDWSAETVRADVTRLAEHGVGILRVFPLWCDFQPLTRVLGGRGRDAGILQANAPLKNPEGVDEEMLKRFRFLCDESHKHGIRLVVGLVTGWMSGRCFVPPALEGRDFITDPESVTWEVRFVRKFVRELKDHPAIAGWDLGNECNCMGAANPHQSWLWMNAIAGVIRAEDPSRPVVSGMHGCSTDACAPWNLAIQGELTDELTTHPYPLFVQGCAVDPFDSLRSEAHPTAESLLYAGFSGRHCFVEEAGDLGRCTCAPERAAANFRAAVFTAWANGLSAYVWWCAFDQVDLGFPPYTTCAIERELGLFTKRMEPKPVLKEMSSLRKFLDSLPAEIRALPPRRVDATVLVSERESAWEAAFGAYLLARQAGFDVTFARAEKLPLPESRFYILPSGTGCDPYSVTAWNAVMKKAEEGATVLVSKGFDTRYSEMAENLGVEVDIFRKTGRSGAFALAGGTIAWSDDTTTRIRAAGAKVLAADGDGSPLMTVFPRGKGRTIFVNFPIEIGSVRRSDCFCGTSPNPQYLVYRVAAELAGVKRRVTVERPQVGLTEHALPDGRTVIVAVNYESSPVDCGMATDGRLMKVHRGEVASDRLRLGANEVAVFEIR